MGAVGIMIILGVIFAPLPDDLQAAGRAQNLYRFFSLFGFLLLVIAKRYLQVPADVLLASDKRRPVLFLRSFEDDERQQFETAEKSFLDFSLETRLSKHFRHFGPFIAIGSPKELVPLLGAARAMLADNEWQSNVLGWIEKSTLVVMYAGKTHWVSWELAKIIEAGRAVNLILMIPEVKGRRRERYQEVARRFESVRDVFRDTIWGSSLSSLRNPRNVRAITFCNDGSIAAIKSRPRNRDSYHLAALVAHYLILERREYLPITLQREEAALMWGI